MSRDLYPKRKPLLLTAIRSLQKMHGHPPSYRQLALFTGLNLVTIHDYVNRLSAEDLITKTFYKHRSIHLTGKADE